MVNYAILKRFFRENPQFLEYLESEDYIKFIDELEVPHYDDADEFLPSLTYALEESDLLTDIIDAYAADNDKFPWFCRFELFDYYKIPDSVKDILSLQFDNCTNLETIVIPKSVEFIRDNAFLDCQKLESIDLSNNNIAVIESQTFFRCKALKSIKLPKYLEEIHSEAFQFCSSLESITIPDSVLSIGGDVFYGCKNLKDIYVEMSEADFKAALGLNADSTLTAIKEELGFYSNARDSVTIHYKR